MRSYSYLLLAAIVLLAACGRHEKAAGTANITPNEKAAIDGITNFYGGTCSFRTTVNHDGKKTATIVESKSQALENAAQIMELNLSNMALMFYRGLKEERKNYVQVQAVFEGSDGKQAERDYPAYELAIVLNKYPALMDVVNAMQARNYVELDTLINDKNGFNHFDKKKLISYIRNTDTLGTIQSFIMYGFIMLKADNGKPVLHMSGLMTRDKHNNQFSVDMDPDDHTNKVIFINYRL